MPQIARDPSCCRARRKPNGLVFLNQLGRGDPDVPLFPHELLFARLKCCVVPKRLIEEFLYQSGSPMCTPDQTLALEPSQVPTNTGGGSLQRCNQLLDADATSLQE